MKAVILARVSTEMQEDGFSLDAQLDRLRNYCSFKGLEIAKEFIPLGYFQWMNWSRNPKIGG